MYTSERMIQRCVDKRLEGKNHDGQLFKDTSVLRKEQLRPLLAIKCCLLRRGCLTVNANCFVFTDYRV